MVVIPKRDIDDFSFADIREEFIEVFTAYFAGAGRSKKDRSKAQNSGGS